MIQRLFPLIALLAAVSVSAADFGRWAPFVPATGRAMAEVMVLDAPADINEISLLVQEAAQKNPAWFRDYAANAAPGEALPYHENMGITEAQYDRLLSGANELILTKAGETEITFSAVDGTVTLRGLPMAVPNNQLLYLPGEDIVKTAHGILTEFSAVNQTDASRPTGRWQGLQWTLSDVKSNTDFAFVKLAIGQLKDKKLNIIFFDVNVGDDAVHDQYHYILFYEGA